MLLLSLNRNMGCCGAKMQPASAPAASPALVILTKEQHAAKRAALLVRLAVLPEHLRLGVTLPGMRELLSQLPSDALEQVNAKIPLDKKTGEPKYPKNDAENGYVNQVFVILWAKEAKLAVCERL